MKIDSGGYVAIWLFANLVAIGIYDLMALFSQGRVSSVSHWIQVWSAQYTVVPFACGVIIGHLFFGVASPDVPGDPKAPKVP